MKVHYKKGCEFNGFLSTTTDKKEEVTCSRCKNKYKLERPKIIAYIVKRGKYFNVLESKFLAPAEAIYGKINVDVCT